MIYVLTLIFNCGIGAVEPCTMICDTETDCTRPQQSASISDSYTTNEKCKAAGALWLSPASNPDGAVRGIACVGIKVR